jgi:hypothetical protein
VISRRTIASVAGAATLALAVASWAPVLATESPASSGGTAAAPAVAVGSIKPTDPSNQLPRATPSSGQTSAATLIATPTSVATASPETTETASPETTETASPETTASEESSTPTAAGTESPQSDLQGRATDSPIPMILVGILVLGLLAGIVTFVALGWRRTRG